VGEEVPGGEMKSEMFQMGEITRGSARWSKGKFTEESNDKRTVSED